MHLGSPSGIKNHEYRRLSLWHDTVPGTLRPRPGLSGDTTADVAIVGAGYTGLWTAYYLLAAEPDLRVAVLESETAGFGASGRNGGWCSALYPVGISALAAEVGRDAALAQYRAVRDAVAEVARVCGRRHRRRLREGRHDRAGPLGGPARPGARRARRGDAVRTGPRPSRRGGGGAPYHLGSRTPGSYDRVPRVFEGLRRTLAELFPVLRDAVITHRWGGPIGIARDWHASVGLDRSTGLAWAGGYVGDGVSTANLAGQTLADLITRRDTDRTALPWVGHRSPDWEPEPLRWLGANAALRAMTWADNAEARGGRPSRLAGLVTAMMGR